MGARGPYEGRLVWGIRADKCDRQFNNRDHSYNSMRWLGNCSDVWPKCLTRAARKYATKIVRLAWRTFCFIASAVRHFLRAIKMLKMQIYWMKYSYFSEQPQVFIPTPSRELLLIHEIHVNKYRILLNSTTYHDSYFHIVEVWVNISICCSQRMQLFYCDWQFDTTWLYGKFMGL